MLRSNISFSDDDKDEDSLLINVIEEGNAMLSNLEHSITCLNSITLDKQKSFLPGLSWYKIISKKIITLKSYIFFSDDDKDEDEDSLLINVIEEGNAMLSNLQILNLQPQVCLRDRDSAYKPINLYHKVGHGKLDMYVINPSKEAKEIREFMERWNGENSKTLGK